MQPTGERRAVLQASKDFLCDCPRCAAAGDDTRRFSCCSAAAVALAVAAGPAGPVGGGSSTAAVITVAKCGGYHLAAQLQLRVVDDPTCDVAATAAVVALAAVLLPCSACGMAATVAYAARVVEQEAVFCKQVAVIKYVLAGGGLRSAAAASVLRLKPAHPHHAHTAEAGYLMWALGGPDGGSGGGGEGSSGTGMLQAALGSRNVILPHASHDDAFRHELLGDALMTEALMGCPEGRGSEGLDALMGALTTKAGGVEGGGGIPAAVGAVPCWQLTAAHEAYCDAVRALALLSGVSHPYSLDACQKLLQAQRSMLPREAAALVHGGAAAACSFCGGARLDGMPMEVCEGCGWASYCCEEHLKLQMPLHKLTCKRGLCTEMQEGALH